ncbi:hypothetical protein ZOSMA_324G00110 [Zostera marina]|uniref:Uncharacterized protein n=1 Tax=Zostera marina TaxID=29655 RepID=A0A0K9PAT3_ZOSMR|nr:hypothetical protein ZOSMA_324G00110 [Zostera marina]
MAKKKTTKQEEIRSIVPELENLVKDAEVKKIRLKEMKRRKSKLFAEVKFLRKKLKDLLRQNQNRSSKIPKNEFSGKKEEERRKRRRMRGVSTVVVPDLNQISIPSEEEEDWQRMKQYSLDTDPTACRSEIRTEKIHGKIKCL